MSKEIGKNADFCEKSVDIRGAMSYTVSVTKKKLSASHLRGLVTGAG